MLCVLATVAMPPLTLTVPPFTRILPAASRLTTIALAALSPVTFSTPVTGAKTAVTEKCVRRSSDSNTTELITHLLWPSRWTAFVFFRRSARAFLPGAMATPPELPCGDPKRFVACHEEVLGGGGRASHKL